MRRRQISRPGFLLGGSKDKADPKDTHRLTRVLFARSAALTPSAALVPARITAEEKGPVSKCKPATPRGRARERKRFPRGVPSPPSSSHPTARESHQSRFHLDLTTQRPSPGPWTLYLLFLETCSLSTTFLAMALRKRSLASDYASLHNASTPAVTNRAAPNSHLPTNMGQNGIPEQQAIADRHLQASPQLLKFTHSLHEPDRDCGCRWASSSSLFATAALPHGSQLDLHGGGGRPGITLHPSCQEEEEIPSA